MLVEQFLWQKATLLLLNVYFEKQRKLVEPCTDSTSYEFNNKFCISNCTFVHNQAAFHNSDQRTSNLRKYTGGSIALFNTTLSINSSTHQ